MSHGKLTKPPEPAEIADGATCLHGTPPLNPRAWAKHVPKEILEAIEGAQKILVVGDVDADGFGSTVALTRTLRALKKDAVAYCQAPPPVEIESMLDKDEVKTGEIKEHYDLVIHVDQGGDRVGEAAAQATANAERVIVIDHHDIKPDPRFLAWLDTGADAAALMVL